MGLRVEYDRIGDAYFALRNHTRTRSGTLPAAYTPEERAESTLSAQAPPNRRSGAMRSANHGRGSKVYARPPYAEGMAPLLPVEAYADAPFRSCMGRFDSVATARRPAFRQDTATVGLVDAGEPSRCVNPTVKSSTIYTTLYKRVVREWDRERAFYPMPI